MSSITLGQIVAAIGIITAIAAFIGKINKIYKENILDKFSILEEKNKEQDQKIDKINENIVSLKQENDENKEEQKLILTGLLACLKGLQEQGCNGPVTESIFKIEKYLIDK